jgi:hypothetical protein
MRYETLGSNRRRQTRVHPVVARLGLALILWTLAAIWILFAQSHGAVLVFGIVSFLMIVFVALPWLLFRLGRNGAPRPDSFRDWMDSDFETESGPIDAREAAVLILLVPLSIALGMTAFGALALMSASGIL